MNAVWSKAEDVGREAEYLAQKHGLLLYDPQGGNVIVPEREKKPNCLRRLLGG